jgi:hypothetical protein
VTAVTVPLRTPALSVSARRTCSVLLPSWRPNSWRVSQLIMSSSMLTSSVKNIVVGGTKFEANTSIGLPGELPLRLCVA